MINALPEKVGYLNTRKTLKVVHLSTSHNGGAGVAARRLHQELIKEGIQSYFVSLSRNSYKIARNEYGVSRNLRSRFISALNAKISKILSAKIYLTLFSVASVRANNLQKFGPPNNTIFHVHNWFNLISLKELKKLLNFGYKVVFTLHDQRLFTGGCHYSLNCTKFKIDCKRCPWLPAQINFLPEINLKYAAKIFKKYSSQIEIIAPSDWIKKLALESKILKNIAIHHVVNVHGEVINEYYARKKAFNVFPKDKVIIGVASVDKNSYLKGGEILEQVEKLLIVKKVNAQILYLSDINKYPDKFKNFWEVIDYLLVPSIIDNSPNVIHEAHTLGIPVIATRVGGVGELLNPEYDYSIELNENTYESIVDVIKLILGKNQKINTQQVSQSYKTYVDKSLDQTKAIYNNLL